MFKKITFIILAILTWTGLWWIAGYDNFTERSPLTLLYAVSSIWIGFVAAISYEDF